LVKVEIIQIKNLKVEAEKGFRRTLFGPELVDPKMEINFVKDSGGSLGCKITFESEFIERETV
jgi:hypothetical protein